MLLKTEIRDEQFHSPSLLGTLLRKLHVDIPLFIGLVLVCACSFVVLYSAGGQEMGVLVRQATRMGIAFVFMIILAHIHPNQFHRHSAVFYIFGIFLLIIVVFVGQTGKGAQRWLDLGFFRFQPSEMIKLTTPMMIAWFLSGYTLPPKTKEFFFAAALIVIPTYLIARQPDLGTSILVASSGVAVLFFAGLSWRFMTVLGVVLISLTPVLWHFMRDYQKGRVLTFLDPESDSMGRGYHIIQSKIAIGSGGVHGKGWLGSTQAELDFLPESSTDFIFAVFAEEFGLLGCIGLLLLYLLIIIRCLYIAVQAQDTYSRLLAGSLTLTFFVYVFVNIGMVIGVLPVVGVPLPLISYGGTSMVTILSGFGIIMSIHTHKKLLSN